MDQNDDEIPPDLVALALEITQNEIFNCQERAAELGRQEQENDRPDTAKSLRGERRRLTERIQQLRRLEGMLYG